MASTLLPFVVVPKPTPAKATISLERRLVRDARILKDLDPSALAFVAHLAADLRERAELSARATIASRAHFVLLCFLIGA